VAATDRDQRPVIREIEDLAALGFPATRHRLLQISDRGSTPHCPCEFFEF
jgi:hypothetical protein